MVAALAGMLALSSAFASPEDQPVEQATRIDSETKEAVRAPLIAYGDFAYVLDAPPSSIRVPSSSFGPSERRHTALVGTIPTRPGEFSGDLAAEEDRRRQGSDFLRLLLAVFLVVVAMISAGATNELQNEVLDTKRWLGLAAVSVLYLASVLAILRNLAIHGELRLYNEYGLGFFGVLLELFDFATPVLLFLIGIGLIGLGCDGSPPFDRWWRLIQIALGSATLLAVIALVVHAFTRDTVRIIVDNATDTPCVVCVDGTRVGVLAEKTRSNVTLCLGSVFHARSRTAAFEMQPVLPSSSAKTVLVDFDASDGGLILNIDAANEYRATSVLYRE